MILTIPESLVVIRPKMAKLSMDKHLVNYKIVNIETIDVCWLTSCGLPFCAIVAGCDTS